MNRTSRAFVLMGKRILEMQEFPLPKIGEDDALLRVEVTGVCGSDWSSYVEGGLSYQEMPCALGHEVVGLIAEIGSQAAKRWGVRVGDRVAVEEYLPCGVCPACLVGDYQGCRETRYGTKSIHDAPSLWGGYSEYMYLHPRSLVHRVDTNTPLELTQLFIPVSNGLYWTQDVGGLRSGGTVVIQGPGPHGLGCVIGARETGAGCIIVVGLSHDVPRLAVAKELGADYTITADTENVPERVKQLTDGEMAQTVINTASSPKAMEQAVHVAALRGTIVQAGLTGLPCTAFDADQISYKLLTIKGVKGRPTRYIKPTLQIIASGKYPLEKMCTHRFPLEQTEWALKTAGGEGEAGAIRVSVLNVEE